MILTIAALAAAPVMAQTAPPAAGATAPKVKMMRVHRGPMFGNVSAEGRAILRESMKSDPEGRAAVKAARDRINDLVAADRLDTAALKRAMEDERRLVDAQHAKRQASLLAAIQKLSPADRKAFAEDARKSRDEVEARVIRWRESMPHHPKDAGEPK
jgi:uncharacterized membrane protein